MATLVEVKEGVDGIALDLKDLIRDNKLEHKEIYGRVTALERRQDYQKGLMNGKKELPHPHKRDADPSLRWHQRMLMVDKKVMLLVVLLALVAGEKGLMVMHHIVDLLQGTPLP